MAGKWAWIEQELQHMAKFTAGTTGVSRPAFSPEEKQARSYIETLMRDMQMTTQLDAAGNLIGRLDGSDPTAAVVAMGAHLDTVPEGGMLDGSLPVLCALAAMKKAHEQGPLRHPLELIVFSGAEPSRFGLAAIGAKAMAGQADPGNWQKLKDEAGISLKEACEASGLVWTELPQAARKAEEMKAFLELALEQGGVLEKLEAPLGVIEELTAPIRFKIAVEGFAAHSEGLPVEEQQDALVAAAMMILAIHEIAQDHSGEGIVATIGQLKVYPGAINVVPGQVEMWGELRGRDGEMVIECMQEVKDAISTIADEQEIMAHIEMLSADRPTALDTDLIEQIEDVCNERGIACRRIASGSSQTLMQMARLTAAGLLVFPASGGMQEQLVEAAEVEIAIDVAAAVLRALAV